jgi:hypothetical protein
MRDYLYCLFFPHPKNNHRAKFLHFRTFLVVISLLIIGGFFFSSGLNPFASKIKALADISTQELLRFTNEKRAENGLPALNENTQLEQAASSKADDMFAKDYWAHNSPDGTTPWVWIKGAGYDYIYAGENLARGFTNSDDVVNAWMASPDHRENLLSENFKDVGFAVKAGKLGGEDTFLVVQEFGNKTPVPVERTGVESSVPPSANTESKVLAFSFDSITPKPTNSISYDFIALIVLSFIMILVIDLVIAKRRKLVRFVGHNLDHIIFLFVVLIVITMFSIGHIL